MVSCILCQEEQDDNKQGETAKAFDKFQSGGWIGEHGEREYGKCLNMEVHVSVEGKKWHEEPEV